MAGLMDELKGDALKSVGILGVVFGFVALFWLWTVGTWAIILVGVMVVAIFVAIKMYWR